MCVSPGFHLELTIPGGGQDISESEKHDQERGWAGGGGGKSKRGKKERERYIKKEKERRWGERELVFELRSTQYYSHPH